jgi:hypothetical protein
VILAHQYGVNHGFEVVVDQALGDATKEGEGPVIRIPAIFFRLTSRLSHSLSLSLLLSMPTKRVGILLARYVNTA